MNKTNKQRDKKTKTKSNTCKPCIHAKNDLHRPREHKVMPNGPSVPKWAQGT